MSSTSTLRIEPLTTATFPALADLFSAGGDPKWCWCSFFRVPRSEFVHPDAAANRAVLEASLVETAIDGRAPGLIALDGDRVVGWVSVGPRADYRRLERSRVLAPIDGAPVWSIVCFVVARRSRGRGVASAMLDAAVSYAREHGATALEAYPTELEPGEWTAAANVFGGTLGMFERAGFEVVARRQANATTRPRPIVRRSL